MAVAVEGLKEFNRAIKAMDKTQQREVRKAFKQSGSIVAKAAIVHATRHGLVDTGNLVRSIKPSLRIAGVFVTARAKNKSLRYPRGYNYPRLHNYRGGGVTQFMEPALEEKTNEVVDEFDKVLVQLQKDWSS